MFNRLKNFIQGSIQELRNVHWPSQGEAIRLTLTVVLISLIIAIFLGGFDFLFTYLLKIFFAR